jgi:hypothetical protein
MANASGSSVVDGWAELSTTGFFGDLWPLLKGAGNIAGAISDLAGLAK